MPRALKKKIRFGNATRKLANLKKEESEENKGGYLESGSGLECPICLGRSDLEPAVREYRYSRKDSLLRHFNSHMLPWSFGSSGRPCDIPGCVDVMPSSEAIADFKGLNDSPPANNGDWFRW